MEKIEPTKSTNLIDKVNDLNLTEDQLKALHRLLNHYDLINQIHLTIKRKELNGD